MEGEGPGLCLGPLLPSPLFIPVLPSLPWLAASSPLEKLHLEGKTIVMRVGLGDTGEWSCKGLNVKNSIPSISWAAQE